MKPWKKKLTILTLGSLCIIGGAKIVQADTLTYSARLPVTGAYRTDACKKSDDGDFRNIVTYNGRPEYRLDFYGMAFKTPQDTTLSTVTSTTAFYGTGTKWAYYVGGGAQYNGKDIYMVIKTGPSTWVEVDVAGNITP